MRSNVEIRNARDSSKSGSIIELLAAAPAMRAAIAPSHPPPRKFVPGALEATCIAYDGRIILGFSVLLISGTAVVDNLMVPGIYCVSYSRQKFGAGVTLNTW